MTRTTQTLPAETSGTDITRFNALRHGILSRYTLLPWENADEYQAIGCVRLWIPCEWPQGRGLQILPAFKGGTGGWSRCHKALISGAPPSYGLQGQTSTHSWCNTKDSVRPNESWRSAS